MSQSVRRRKPLACQRCRKRKARCDSLLPSCSNCSKANVPCEEVKGAERMYVLGLVQRIDVLEGILRGAGLDVDGVDGGGDGRSVSRNVETVRLDRDIKRRNSFPVTPTTSLSAEQPLAQSVGMISLGHSSDPKYLGPSSGVSFARMIFAAAPPGQGLSIITASSHFHSSGNESLLTDSVNTVMGKASLPSISEVSHFVSAYVDTFHYLYPFLGETAIEALVEGDHSQFSPADQVILYLVLSLGARTLESQMKSSSFSSTSYFNTAVDLISRVQLHESIKGVQIMLLLALATFIFPTAPNAWFLVSTIIASCVDLGLQRKQTGKIDEAEQNIRRGVFWSAYSLDRMLCTTLGRPLTLRDEAIDIEYPGQGGSYEIYMSAIDAAHQFNPQQEHVSSTHPTSAPEHHQRIPHAPNSPFTPAIFSFRFDRIMAEIKLMIYRVVQIPSRFPWPNTTDLTTWQSTAHSALNSLIAEARHILRPNRLFGRGTYSDQVLPSLELKYHQCITILFRPSPAFPRPTPGALKICYDSAAETIRIHHDMLRFGRLGNSWVAAHTVFVAGITLLYFVWINPGVVESPTIITTTPFHTRMKSCSKVLDALGKTWTVAKDAQQKLDYLLQITETARADRDREHTLNTPHYDKTNPLNNTHNNGDAADSATHMNADTEFSFDASWDAPVALWDELGDMRSLFDLEWFGENLDVGQTSF